MPRGDRTGPEGSGPMSGRAMGYCAGYDQPGFATGPWGRGWHRGPGRGMGRGFRRGMGFGPGYGAGYGRMFGYGPSAGWGAPVPPRYTEADRRAFLEEEAQALESRLDSIRREMDGIGEAEGSEGK